MKIRERCKRIIYWTKKRRYEIIYLSGMVLYTVASYRFFGRVVLK